MSNIVEKSVSLACDIDRAFVLFTEHASEWWPEGRRHLGDPKSEIRMLASGRFFERAGDGREAELGRVILWDPPHRVVLDFFVGTDADHPTEVTITFAAEPVASTTRVSVRHGPKPVSQELYDKRAPQFERSWTMLLEALALHAART